MSIKYVKHLRPLPEVIISHSLNHHVSLTYGFSGFPWSTLDSGTCCGANPLVKFYWRYLPLKYGNETQSMLFICSLLVFFNFTIVYGALTTSLSMDWSVKCKWHTLSLLSKADPLWTLLIWHQTEIILWDSQPFSSL